jgi:very-short-patch-repair endonuclease
MTTEEQMLWAALWRNQLGGYHFRRQQIIGQFVADFYCHAARLVIEVDGPIHDEQFERDGLREAMFTELGFHVLRIPNADIHRDLRGVLERIYQRIKALEPNSAPNPSEERLLLPSKGRGPGVRSRKCTLGYTTPHQVDAYAHSQSALRSRDWLGSRWSMR